MFDCFLMKAAGTEPTRPVVDSGPSGSSSHEALPTLSEDRLSLDKDDSIQPGSLSHIEPYFEQDYLKKRNAASPDCPQVREVPRVAHTLWLRREKAGKIPAEDLAKVKQFLRLNPDVKLNFWTDNVRATRREFADVKAKNICVRNFREVPKNTGFPRSEEYVHGVRRALPESAKDVLSWMILAKHPGLFFDVNTNWHIPLPSKINIVGSLAGSRNFDNKIVLFSGTDNAVKEILEASEQAIGTRLDRDTLPNNDVLLHVNRRRNYGRPHSFGSADIVNRVGFYAFHNTIIERRAPYNTDRILGCTARLSQKAWDKRSHEMTEIRVKRKYVNQVQ